MVLVELKRKPLVGIVDGVQGGTMNHVTRVAFGPLDEVDLGWDGDDLLAGLEGLTDVVGELYKAVAMLVYNVGLAVMERLGLMAILVTI